MTTRTEQAKATRIKIIGTALDILSTEGAASLTSGTLSRRLGMSKGTLFHHFKNMEEIHLAVLESITKTMTKDVDAKEYDSASKLFEAVVDAVFTEYEVHRGVHVTLLHFIGIADHNETYRLKLKDLFEEMISSWERSLKSHLPAHVSQDKIGEVIRIMDMYFNGLLVHDLMFKEPIRYKKITNIFLNQMLQYLK